MNKILREDFERIAASINLDALHDAPVVITGAGGFIGSYIMEFLEWLGGGTNDYRFLINLVGLDNYIASKEVFSWNLRNADITKPSWDWQKFVARAHYVLNLASIAAPAFIAKYPLQTIEVNISGIWNVLDAAMAPSKVKRVCHFSSVEVYGDPTVIPTPESYFGNVSPNDKRSIYTESKRASETVAMAFFREKQVPVIIVRPFNIYGPCERLDDGRVIPNLIRALRGEMEFGIHYTSSSRSYCYISDAVTQIFAALLKGEPGEVYNIGDGNSEVTLYDLADAAGHALGKKNFWKLDVKSEGLPSRRRPDTQKILKIAPAPKVSLEEGIRRTFEYYDEADHTRGE